jgi:hypothetical protein
MAWDTTKHVKFLLPFRDVKPELYLDNLLPRIVILAEGSSIYIAS